MKSVLGLLIIVGAVIAVLVTANWLRDGGGYDDKTVGRIGPEPKDWKPHEAQPWEAEQKP